MVFIQVLAHRIHHKPDQGRGKVICACERGGSSESCFSIIQRMATAIAPFACRQAAFGRKTRHFLPQVVFLICFCIVLIEECQPELAHRLPAGRMQQGIGFTKDLRSRVSSPDASGLAAMARMDQEMGMKAATT
ncbi:MAG: hypothetical protein JJT99_02995 [Rhodobacteraceae bacterium]|nr:hypothetical protein [Paracoccaceae bacterium]